MAVLLIDGKKNFRDAIDHAMETFSAEIDPSLGIFIKPNIVFAARPGSGEITPPKLVKALIMSLRERYNNIDIILGEGVAAGCDPQVNFQVSGYATLARELGVTLLDLNQAERETVVWKFGKLKLPKAALERTYINLPILKPSSACVISGALKNQKGLLTPAVKKQFHHQGLHEQIAALNMVVRPALTIMDGSYYFGRYTLIAGNNCGEIDATACDLLGIEEPEHIQLARKAQVFVTGFAVTGDKIKTRRGTARPALKEYKRLGRLRLWSNPKACTGCRAIFRDIKHHLLKPQNFLAGGKLLAHSLKGAEIVMGTNPQWRKEYKTIICIGTCTRKVAEEGGYIYIPGCPPTVGDFIDHLP